MWATSFFTWPARALGLLLLIATPLRAELVVVARADDELVPLTRQALINIYMGRHRLLPTGVLAVPIDQPKASEARSTFYRRLVGKTPAEINAYWARLYFSGKTTPPVTAESNDGLLRLLAETPNAIAYIDRADMNTQLHQIVFEFPPEP